MKIQPTPNLGSVRNALAACGPGLPSVKLGVVDGLPDLCHPALRSARIDVLATMIPPGSAAADPHGTAVCSLIFGDQSPVNGVAPGCSGLILPLFLRRTADNKLGPVSQMDLARALAFGLEHGVSIFNISAGQKSATAEADAHLDQALQHCVDRRVLVMAAAGNEGCACIHLPATVETVLPIGALNVAGQPLEASNWGEAYRRDGILAPGENLQVAVPGGGVSTGTGTSFATAIVSGVAALLLSVARREGYRLDPLDIRQILIDSAAPCELAGTGECDRYLAGTLDAAGALAAVHRAGTTSISFAPLQTVKTEHALAQSDHQHQYARMRPGMGGVVMSAEISNANVSDTAAIAPSGVAASACACEPQDKDAKTELSPQAASPPITPAAPESASASIKQLACSCGKSEGGCSCGGSQAPQLVFALGALWFDFGTEARYDAIVQQIGDPVRANNPAELFAFLRQNLHFAAGITFILMQDQIPLYAIQPAGPFALPLYNAMLEALEASLDDIANREQRVSIPGTHHRIHSPAQRHDGAGCLSRPAGNVPMAVAGTDRRRQGRGRQGCRARRRHLQLSQPRLLRAAQSRRCPARACAQLCGDQRLSNAGGVRRVWPDEISRSIPSRWRRARSAGPIPIAGTCSCKCSIRRTSAAPAGFIATPSTSARCCRSPSARSAHGPCGRARDRRVTM